MKPLYITTGEPAGIGPDICLELADFPSERALVVLANRELMQQRAQQLNNNLELIEYHGQITPAQIGQLYIKSLPLAQPV